jgi:hypothetical protein
MREREGKKTRKEMGREEKLDVFKCNLLGT